MGKGRNHRLVSKQTYAWQRFVARYSAEISADLLDGLPKDRDGHSCILTWASGNHTWYLFDCVALWLYIYERNRNQELQWFHTLLQDRFLHAKGSFPEKSKYDQRPLCEQSNLIALFISYAGPALLSVFAEHVNGLHALHAEICLASIPLEYMDGSLANCSIYSYCLSLGHELLGQEVARIVRANQRSQDQVGLSMAQLAVVHCDDILVDFVVAQLPAELMFDTNADGASALSLAFEYGNDFALRKMFSKFQNVPALRQALVGDRKGVSRPMQAFFQSERLYTCEMTTFLLNRMQEEGLCNERMMHAFSCVIVWCLSDKRVMEQEKYAQDKSGYIALLMQISQQLSSLDPLPLPSGAYAAQIGKHNAIRQQVFKQLDVRSQAKLALPECLALDDMPLGITFKYIDVLGDAYCQLIEHLFMQNRSQALIDWLKMYRYFSKCSYMFSAFFGVPSTQCMPWCYPNISIAFAWLTEYVVTQPKLSISAIRWYLFKQTIAFLQRQGQVLVSTGNAWSLVVKTAWMDDFFSADRCEERKQSTLEVIRYLLQNYASQERIAMLHRSGFFHEVCQDAAFWRFMLHGDLNEEDRLRLTDWLLFLLEEGDVELLACMHAAYVQTIETQQRIRDDTKEVIVTMEIIRERVEKTMKESITMKPYKACQASDTGVEQVVSQTHEALVSIQNKVLENVVSRHKEEMKDKDNTMLRLQQEIETLKASFTVMANDRSQLEDSRAAKNNAKLNKQLQAAQKELQRKDEQLAKKDEQLAKKDLLQSKSQKDLEEMQARWIKALDDAHRFSMHAEMLRRELRIYETDTRLIPAGETKKSDGENLDACLNDQEKISKLEERCGRLRRKDRVRSKAFASFVDEQLDEHARYLQTHSFMAVSSVGEIRTKK